MKTRKNKIMLSIRILSVTFISIILQQLAYAKEPIVLQTNDIQSGEDPGATMASAKLLETQEMTFWIYHKGNGLSLVEGNFDDDDDEELKYSNEDGAYSFQVGLRHEFSKTNDIFLENIDLHPTLAFECIVLPDETSQEVDSVEIRLTFRGRLPEEAVYSSPVHKIPVSEFGVKQTIRFEIGQNEEFKKLKDAFLQNSDAKRWIVTLQKVSRPDSAGGEGVKNSSTVILDDFRLE